MTATLTYRALPASAPQSWDEVGPVEAELRLLDDAIRIEWEPKAVMTKRGGYDAQGRVISPVYDGRWKVVKKGDPNRTASWREDALITYVTTPVTIGHGTKRVHAMTADGPYAPVGPWLVEHMRSWDRANHAQALQLSRLLDEHNAAKDAAAERDAEAGETEVLEKMFIEGTIRGGVSAAHPVAIDLKTTE